MENSDGSQETNKNPFQCIIQSCTDDISSSGEGHVVHHRASSDVLALVEQPSWLDDLLNEPDMPATRRCHRRSSSDSISVMRHSKDALDKQQHQIWDKNTSLQISRSSAKSISKQDQADPRTCLARSVCSQSNPSHSRAETKRAKQHNAHRGRTRKLQYIADLERNVQILQAEGSEVSAELEYLDQQIIILGLENRALRQRLNNLSQEQLIKYMEHDMLERELGRLQFVYQQQQQMNSLHYQSKNRDLNSQFSNLSMHY